MGKILLVEGEGDKSFFEVLLKAIDFAVEVRVSTPKNFGGNRDGKTPAMRLLPELMQNLSHAEITHLAMVVDADYKVTNGLGYEGTVKKAKEKLGTGYGEPIIIGSSGLSFPHLDGLNPIGLWVMPDNVSEGMFEDWVKKSVNLTEKSLLDGAISAVKNLPQPPKFQPIHQSKAEIATWLAWQKMPAQGYTSENIRELLDFESEPMKQLIKWLKAIYG